MVVQLKMCFGCDGKGHVWDAIHSEDGFAREQYVPCRECFGRGTIEVRKGEK